MVSGWSFGIIIILFPVADAALFAGLYRTVLSNSKEMGRCEWASLERRMAGQSEFENSRKVCMAGKDAQRERERERTRERQIDR